MKVAEVRYRGRMQTNRVRGPSKKEYRFTNPMGGSPRPTAVDSVEDAQYFEEQGSPFEVEWTTKGELLKRVSGPAVNAAEAVEEFGYQKKKQLASALGVEPESSHPTSEELNEELEPAVEDLKRQMEN